MEVEGCVWEILYAFKALYDHGKHHELLDKYRNQELCGDDYYDFTVASIPCIFEDTREYYNDENDVDAYIFFDRIITEFYSLCARYEKERNVNEKENPFRTAMDNALRTCMYFDSYAYDYRIYSNPESPGGCRLVLLLCCEFDCYYEIIPGLLDAYEAYENHTLDLKKELGTVPKDVYRAKTKEAA